MGTIEKIFLRAIGKEESVVADDELPTQGIRTWPAFDPKPGEVFRVQANKDIVREIDPTGRSAKDAGAKLDAGKNRLGLVLMDFAPALLEVGKVGTFGANKYTPHGWIDVPDGENRYTDALFRHLFAEGKGEVIDPDSQLLHAAQTAWNALARLTFILKRMQPGTQLGISPDAEESCPSK